MLWYKGWLETRLKLVVCVVFMCVALIALYKLPGLPNGSKPRTLEGVAAMLNMVMVMNACTWLAGAGIVTQPAFQATKGIHGSTLFTLSLPVSRFRLLAVRAGLGWMLMAGSIVAFSLAMLAVSPALRSITTPTEMVEYVGTVLACASAFYFGSVLLATFLEDTWRITGGVLVYMALWGISAEFKLPVFADVLRAMGQGSPLMAHTVPWSAIGFSLVLSALMIFESLKIVQAREY
jgi:ABC-2 type transport system permease protein